MASIKLTANIRQKILEVILADQSSVLDTFVLTPIESIIYKAIPEPLKVVMQDPSLRHYLHFSYIYARRTGGWRNGVSVDYENTLHSPGRPYRSGVFLRLPSNLPTYLVKEVPSAINPSGNPNGGYADIPWLSTKSIKEIDDIYLPYHAAYTKYLEFSKALFELVTGTSSWGALHANLPAFKVQLDSVKLAGESILSTAPAAATRSSRVSKVLSPVTTS